jgi:hypothetical protein
MCLKSDVNVPEIAPTPPAPPPAEVLTQSAPDKAKAAKSAQTRKKKLGTKGYRAGSNKLAISGKGSSGTSVNMAG